MYSIDIERLISQAPRDQIQVHISEEFFADPRAGYLQALRFLGLEDDGRTDFRVYNPAFVSPLRTPMAWVNRAYKRSSMTYRAAKQIANAFGVQPGAWLFSYTKNGRRPRGALASLSSDFQQSVREWFEPDIRRLEALLGRDLSVWRADAPRR
jgi:hypothetical protein